MLKSTVEVASCDLMGEDNSNQTEIAQIFYWNDIKSFHTLNINNRHFDFEAVSICF